MKFLKKWFSRRAPVPETAPEKTCVKVLLMSRETADALRELAAIVIDDSEIVDAETKNEQEQLVAKTSQLIRDALRLFEWVCYQQVANDREIAALPGDAMTYVLEHFPVDCEKDCLGCMVLPGKEEAAKRFFSQEKPPLDLANPFN